MPSVAANDSQLRRSAAWRSRATARPAARSAPFGKDARNLTPPRGVLHSLRREGDVQSVLMAANIAKIACPVGLAAYSVTYLVKACEHPLDLSLLGYDPMFPA